MFHFGGIGGGDHLPMAGNGETDTLGDGGMPLETSLDLVTDLAYDDLGYLYFCTAVGWNVGEGRDRVRRFWLIPED